MKRFQLIKQSKADKYVNLVNFNRLIDVVNALQNLQFDPRYFNVTGDPSGTYVTFSGTTTFPWSSLAFGYLISGAVVTIYGGEIQIGASTPIGIGEQTRTIIADYQYVAAEYTWGTQALAIGSPTTVKPVSTETVFKRWLYQFRFQSGNVSLCKIGNMGNIMIPAAYGD